MAIHFLSQAAFDKIRRKGITRLITTKSGEQKRATVEYDGGGLEIHGPAEGQASFIGRY